MTALDRRYQKDSAIVSREIVGEVILVPIRQNVGDLESIYTLNETAACAWALIDGERTLAQILGQLLVEFGVERGQAQADLLELFAQLEEIGAVVQV